MGLKCSYCLKPVTAISLKISRVIYMKQQSPLRWEGPATCASRLRWICWKWEPSFASKPTAIHNSPTLTPHRQHPLISSAISLFAWRGKGERGKQTVANKKKGTAVQKRKLLMGRECKGGEGRWHWKQETICLCGWGRTFSTFEHMLNWSCTHKVS